MSDNNTTYPIDDKGYRYQIALKSMNIGTWEWNIQTDELIFDDRYAEMLGYQKEELLPATVDLWRKLIHEDDLQKTLDEIDNHFQNHTEYYDIEFRIKHKDGKYIWVLSKGRVTEFNENGYPLKMFGAHLDITDSKTLEKINLNTKYNNLIENAPYPVIVTNYKTGLVTYGNERARQLFGVNFEQAINKTALDFYVNPSDRDQFINNLHEKHNVSDFEVQLYKSYREKFWALISASFTLFNDELSVLITINDITRRKEIEIDLNSEKNKYQLLAESMADVIMVFNLNTLNFSYISPSVFDLRGLSVEEAHQEKFDDIIFVNDRVNILNNLRNDAQKYLENPDLKKTTIYEFQEYCKNGRLVWVEASFKFRINENRDVEIISIHRNIDERKKIESRIEYMNLHEINTGLLNKTAFRFYQDKWANQSDLNLREVFLGFSTSRGCSSNTQLYKG